MVNAIISTFVLGLAALASAAPGGVPGKPTSGAPSKTEAPMPDEANAPTPNPNAPTTYSSGGAGAWSFDFNYLGCNTGDAKCSSPVWSRYSPEASPQYLTSKGGNIEVRLWTEMTGIDADLYVEEYTNQGWKVVHSSTNGGWQDKVVFSSKAGASYRFRAYRYSGAGYYVLSWKYA